ncbi:MAG: VWA domain-containing protein [Planctomycetes bacterium]|nr:VWA domain-containing protein [Planctomycetota bacterium]
MNLANPVALAWAALAIPIVIFYILKIRLRRAPVSTMLFWRQIYDEKQPRSIWQRLRHLISLLVQLALLMLLVLALTEPFFNWEVLQARRLVLVLDNSASMNATDVSPSRLAEAKQRAEQFIRAMRFRDEMAVVSAGAQPKVVCGLSSHQRTLLKALDGVLPSDGPTRVPEAVTLAEQLLADHKHGQVIVLSDGCFQEAEKLAANPRVQFEAVGGPSDNVGVTQFQVRRSLLDPIGYQILAEVQNASKEPVECRIEIDLDGNVVDVVPLKLDPDGRWRHTFEKTSAEGGQMTARVDHPDALAADNEAWALLPKRLMQPVNLVGGGNLFLEKSLQANQLVELKTFATPDDLPKLPAGPSTDAPERTATLITVFHRRVPEKLPDGAVLVIDPENSCDLWEVGEKLENPIVAQQDADSPLMLHVQLHNVLMPEARRLSFLSPPKVLASAIGGEPLYAAIERPAGKVLVLTVNLDQGDLPLRTAFPIMTANALTWFAGTLGELRESLACGAVTTAEIEAPHASGRAGRDRLVLWTPSGERRQLPEGRSALTIGPLDQCGVWAIAFPESEEADRPSRVVWEAACNLASAAESDIRTPESLVEQQRPAAAMAGIITRPIWFYLLAAAWLLAAVEWYLYQRRWIS